MISEEYTELKLTIKKDLKTKIDQVKSLLSHQNPEGDLNKLLELMCDIVIKKKVPTSQRRASTAPKVSRYIPSTVKQEVYFRDKGCCTFTDHKTKQKCLSTHLLQYDHIKPIAFNGETSVQNLRLLCFQHHKLVTDQIFGISTRSL
jgi:5-methylcytosine-specific restriction endonuclease McrA